MADERPSPDALLARIKDRERPRLRIYIGAAPGVGKTYAMLREAHLLRERGLDTLLVTGTVTNVCCESTARDAMMLNFRTVMITDGNAANTDEDHNAALSNFYLTFGDIMSTDFAIDCLRRNARKGLAAAE